MERQHRVDGPLRIAFLACVLISTLTSLHAASAGSAANYDRGTGRVLLTNGRLELLIETQHGLNPRQLRDVKSGRLLADGDYVWLGGGLPTMLGAPHIVNRGDGSSSVTLTGQLGKLVVEQSFTAPAKQPAVIIERVTITNPADHALDTGFFKCGFAKRLRVGEKWAGDAKAIRLSPIPYRRETNGKLMESPLSEVVEHGMSFRGWQEPPHETPVWGAEGWVWSDGANALLVAKYNPDAMEWSLMEPLQRGPETFLRFAGAGEWKHGSPEGATQLQAGKSFQFGETLLQVVDGDWKQAYYAYRHFTESKGNHPHDGYNPPVHWNEIYDNQYFFKVARLPINADFTPTEQKLEKEFYTLDMMKAEAAKAREIGCEALYLDPGWDTGAGYHIWDAERLGSMDSFVKMLHDEYGLKLSLWLDLAGAPPTYSHPDACPVEARVVDKDDKRTDLQCLPSPAYLDTKTKRLLDLGRHGAAFLMFDSTQFTGPCYDRTHGHSIPSTREEHAHALLELAQRVKSQYPQLLIEMHDPISGPSGIHYTPTYYQYAKPNSFDCLWGHEFMWDSMKDLAEGRALSLYYYNLAYSVPLYLHINLKTDNANALAFWWYASTIRHLGMGGKGSDPAVWAAHVEAMRTYLPLKRFYTQGVFYGLDETVHAHTLPDLRESVINCFNLGSKPVHKQMQFRPAEVGLPPGAVQVEGASFTAKGNEITMTVDIPAMAPKLVKVHVASNR